MHETVSKRLSDKEVAHTKNYIQILNKIGQKYGKLVDDKLES